MKNLRKYVFFVFATFLAKNVCLAAPLKTLSTLPLTGEDLIKCQNTINDFNELKEFIVFIKGIDVFSDHKNPKTVKELEDKNIIKTFFATPYFQASEERESVGGQEIAEQGMKIIAEAYELLTAFDFELLRISQLTQEIKRKSDVIRKLRKSVSETTDNYARANTEKLISEIQQEISQQEEHIKTLENRASQGLDETSSALKKQVVNQVLLKLSFLGVSATTEERQKLNSNNASILRDGLTSVIARTTGLGQFGYRNAIFEAGYTSKQKKWIGLYKTIRPDVKVVSLHTNSVYARATALSSKSDQNFDDDSYFLSNSQIVNAPRIFLSVNGGSNGACGGTKACNVIMEFTWLGATMAKSSRSGSVVMPIYFDADVKFKQPDFEGTISCNFKNGFKVEGRADVKDGGIIYDGDVNNQINYSTNENGSCNYSIDKGDGDSAAYYTIKALFDSYLKLKMQRAAKSRSEVDRYREYVNQELNYHSNNSQSSNYDFWSLNTWINAFGGTAGPVVSYVLGKSRDFYWHTRTENYSVTEAVEFTTHIKEINIDKAERVSFDGFTLLCWKKNETEILLAACPSKNIAHYQEQADTDLGKSQKLCGNESTSTSCIEDAEESSKNTNTNDDGVIGDPWA